MAVDKVPVLKRCRSLGLDPVFLGVDKKSNRQARNARRKMSEYGLQLREKQKAKFIYGVVAIKESMKTAQRYKDITEVTGGRMVPAWLEVDEEKLSATIKNLPHREEIDVPVNEMLIVELYSK